MKECHYLQGRSVPAGRYLPVDGHLVFNKILVKMSCASYDRDEIKIGFAQNSLIRSYLPGIVSLYGQ